MYFVEFVKYLQKIRFAILNYAISSLARLYKCVKLCDYQNQDTYLLALVLEGCIEYEHWTLQYICIDVSLWIGIKSSNSDSVTVSNSL